MTGRAANLLVNSVPDVSIIAACTTSTRYRCRTATAYMSDILALCKVDSDVVPFFVVAVQLAVPRDRTKLLVQQTAILLL